MREMMIRTSEHKSYEEKRNDFLKSPEFKDFVRAEKATEKIRAEGRVDQKDVHELRKFVETVKVVKNSKCFQDFRGSEFALKNTDSYKKFVEADKKYREAIGYELLARCCGAEKWFWQFLGHENCATRLILKFSE